MTPCPVCGNPPIGYAVIDGKRYCHPDTAATRGVATCWELARSDRDAKTAQADD